MTVDVTIVGGGVVGIATALNLLQREPTLDIVLLEAEAEVGLHQSGRNSGVVHAGVYYRPNSAKARLCRAGREELLAFAGLHGIPIAQRGKVIVALDREDERGLDRLAERARANGLVGIRSIGTAELSELEPAVVGCRALVVPETAVIDFARVSAAMAEEVRRRGGDVRTSWPLTAARRRPGGWMLDSRGRTLEARMFVGCAGIFADQVLRMTGEALPGSRTIPVRGGYYDVIGASADLVRGLVYPVPDPRLPFLGVHFTRGVDGTVHVGPNAVIGLGRSGDERRSLPAAELARTAIFPGLRRLAWRHARSGAGEVLRDRSRHLYARAARRYVPDLRTADLRRSAAGVRAQRVRRDGRLLDDFLIHEGERSVHVLNAPSPAATACLAIGGIVAARVLETLRSGGR